MIACNKISSKGDVTTTISTVSKDGVVVDRNVREEWHSVSWKDFCEWIRGCACLSGVCRRPVSDDVNFIKGALRIDFDSGARAVVISEYQEDLSDATPGEGLRTPTVMVWPPPLDLNCHEGRDLHTEFAAFILGISYEEGLARYTNRNRNRIHDYEWDRARQMAKAAHVSFPLNPRVEWFVEWALSHYGISLTLEQAKMLKEKWDVSPTRDVVAKLVREYASEVEELPETTVV